MNVSPGRHQHDPFRDTFPAQLTAVSGTPPRYDWTEQRLDAEGNYADADAARTGSAAGVNAAREVNDRVVDVPTYVWMRLRGGGPDGDLIYEFQAGGGSTPAEILCQLTGKTYSGPCPVYTGFRVTDTGACTYSDAAVPAADAVCLPVYHEQYVDVVVAPPPSPRNALPGTLEDDSAAGDVAWSNADAAGLSNDSYATCSLAAGQATHYLKVTGFCFQLPSTTTSIDTVEVRVEAHADGGSVVDAEVKLVVGGTITGTSQHTGVALGTTDAVRSYSHDPTTWTGGALTYSQVNASNFGVAVRHSNGSGEGRVVSVDAVEMRVSFTPSSSGVVGACVVRLRLGDDGTYYLFGGPPRWEYVEMDTAASPVTIDSVVYQPGWLLRYDQATKDFVTAEDVLVRDVSGLS